ncbi:L-threonylcarbamoyladenylate synthase [Rhodospirillaceae bacterium SYSU D60014]|uniref:L-threonylcarbamoyladenylate synthase n=1 Tax=Virgifigura deserti TaxID=2268457 RepID=UPI000E664E60
MTESAPILPPTADALAAAGRALAAGRLVAFPTETVYGLGADATNDHAVAAVFATKGRPRFNPLIVHFAEPDAARGETDFDDRADALARAFWPGPLTLVLPRRAESRIALLASAGLDTLAVRVPRHPVAQALLTRCERPLAAPSANVSGKISPTTAAHVADSLGGKVAMILDGGACSVGVESTVVDLTGDKPRLLRPGGITEEQLAAVVGPLATVSTSAGDEARPSPGMLASHYAPDLPLRLDAGTLRSGEALLAFGPQPLPGAAAVANLSPSGDLTEAAANLFAMLRTLDRPGLTGIAAMPVPDHGLGRAINDRLRRAAARRSG